MSDTYRPNEPTVHTRAVLDGVAGELPFDDVQDFEDAARGFLGTSDLSQLRNAAGRPVWNLEQYDFLKGNDAAASVNPSLLRLARLNLHNGLFEVADGVYQVRGFDLSNMTLVEGDTGVIIIDPLVSVETASAALSLYREHRGDRPVTAVIFTHSHVDHYGGVRGVVTLDDVASGNVRVIAPEGFLEEAVAENVFAGNAMQRRSVFQYGYLLPSGPLGSVDAGLGKATSSGSVSLIAPTEYVSETGETLTVDGVEIEFVMAPHTEAPSEFMLWFPKWNLLNAAENVTHTIHNLLTLRGAQVRDAVNWWKALHGLLTRYRNRVEILIAQHHWPTWGNERVCELIADQRDLYKFTHDEVLRLANQGYTLMEIPELIELPAELGNKWHNRGYYGSVHHNAKAVYQRYLGWWDGNPSTFYAHPPAESAKRFVELAGGADVVLERVQASFDAGDYRWVAEVANKLVFADPSNRDARELGARALEQLGYQTENPTWRNAFLNGARELVLGAPQLAMPGLASVDVVSAMTPEMLLDYLGIRVDGRAAAGLNVTLRWILPEAGESYLLEVRNGVVIYGADREVGADREASTDLDVNADREITINAELTAPKQIFAGLVLGVLSFEEALGYEGVKASGDAGSWADLIGYTDKFPSMFNVVEP